MSKRKWNQEPSAPPERAAQRVRLSQDDEEDKEDLQIDMSFTKTRRGGRFEYSSSNNINRINQRYAEHNASLLSRGNCTLFVNKQLVYRGSMLNGRCEGQGARYEYQQPNNNNNHSENKENKNPKLTRIEKGVFKQNQLTKANQYIQTTDFKLKRDKRGVVRQFDTTCKYNKQVQFQFRISNNHQQNKRKLLEGTCSELETMFDHAINSSSANKSQLLRFDVLQGSVFTGQQHFHSLKVNPDSSIVIYRGHKAHVSCKQARVQLVLPRAEAKEAEQQAQVIHIQFKQPITVFHQTGQVDREYRDVDEKSALGEFLGCHKTLEHVTYDFKNHCLQLKAHRRRVLNRWEAIPRQPLPNPHVVFTKRFKAIAFVGWQRNDGSLYKGKFDTVKQGKRHELVGQVYTAKQLVAMKSFQGGGVAGYNFYSHILERLG